MTVTDRRGFTLVELLVVVVLGGFIVLATYQVLIINSRTYAVNNAQIQGQQSLRAGLDVLFGEIREISAGQGDILDMGSNSITIRTPRAFGLVCTTDYTASPPALTVLKAGPPILTGDSIFVFADNNIDRASDDVWLTRHVQASDTTATCGSDPAQTLRVPDLASTGDTVRAGAPVRAFQVYSYGLYEIDGESYLGRQMSTAGSPDPLVGPLLPSTGVAFRYLDAVGSVTTSNTDVAQIEVILRYRAGIRDARNRLVSDSIVARVYPRN
ncbi:MAG: prepilin-type N-terminal cleavage/methylation domain-containing protein [Longimicrobiales bacterium]